MLTFGPADPVPPEFVAHVHGGPAAGARFHRGHRNVAALDDAFVLVGDLAAVLGVFDPPARPAAWTPRRLTAYKRAQRECSRRRQELAQALSASAYADFGPAFRVAPAVVAAQWAVADSMWVPLAGLRAWLLGALPDRPALARAAAAFDFDAFAAGVRQSFERAVGSVQAPVAADLLLFIER